MARIEIEITDKLVFSTELEVRMSDINPANHVGHDAFISLVHEARVRFFEHLGFPILGADKKGLIIADLAVSYKLQAFYKDRLRFEIGAGTLTNMAVILFTG